MNIKYIKRVVLVAVFCLPISVNAALIVNGNGTISDTDLNIMWLESTGPAANHTDALNWADSLVYAGFDNWRLPSANGLTSGVPDTAWSSTDNEFGHLYLDEWGNPANLGQIAPMNYSDGWYWTSTLDPLSTEGDAYAFFWSFDGLALIDSSAEYSWTANNAAYVTAVRDLTAAEIEAAALFMTDRGDTYGFIYPDTDPGNGDQTSVPEPATLALMGLGLAGLGFRKRKTG